MCVWYKCMFTHMCAGCVWGGYKCARTCVQDVYVRVKYRAWHLVISSYVSPYFLRHRFSLIRKLNTLANMADQWVFRMYLHPFQSHPYPCTRVINVRCWAQLLHGCWESNLKSSCLHSNRVTTELSSQPLTGLLKKRIPIILKMVSRKTEYI